MSTADRERPQPVSEAAAAPGAQKPHELLAELVMVAGRETDEAEQRRYTVEVVDALIAMRAPGDEAEECRVLVAQLEAKTLHRLTDTKGRSAHKEAVETLLSLGFPHALQVSPEDLDKYRNGSVGHELLGRVRARKQASSIAFVTQAASAAYWAYAQPNAALPWVIGSLVLGLGGAGFLRGMLPREGAGLPAWMLGLSTCAAFIAGFSAPVFFGVFAGMLMANFFLWQDQPKEDDA